MATSLAPVLLPVRKRARVVGLGGRDTEETGNQLGEQRLETRALLLLRPVARIGALHQHRKVGILAQAEREVAAAHIAVLGEHVAAVDAHVRRLAEQADQHALPFLGETENAPPVETVELRADLRDDAVDQAVGLLHARGQIAGGELGARQGLKHPQVEQTGAFVEPREAHFGRVAALRGRAQAHQRPLRQRLHGDGPSGVAQGSAAAHQVAQRRAVQERLLVPTAFEHDLRHQSREWAGRRSVVGKTRGQ